jgi:hypothetical protein
MSNVQNFAAQAELAFAAYANLRIGDNLASDFATNNSGIPDALAITLSQGYRVIDILNDTTSGAYAVVFEDKTGSRTLAVRGTSEATDVAADTHLLIGVPSNLNPQYKALSAKVDQWRAAGVISQTTTLTGHSLGGYLVTALKSSIPGSFGSAYTYNAPGLGTVFGTWTQFLRSTFGIGAIASDVFDLRGTMGASFIAGLGQHWGKPVPVEIEAASGVGLGNHSVGRISQPLALLNVLAQMDSSLTLERGNELVRVSSNAADNTLENLLQAVYLNFNGNAKVTATGDDQAFYQRLTDLQALPSFAALKGKVTLSPATTSLATTAKTDFAAFLSLNALSPVVLSTTDTTAIAKLKQANETLAQQWEADSQLTGAQRSQGLAAYSDNWYADRAAMLSWVVQRNTTDNTDLVMTANAEAVFEDVASRTVIRIGARSTGDSDRRVFRFGDDNANTLAGNDKNDRLHGGAGNDTLNGMGGNDYLEGGSGADIYNFSGTFGQDTVVDSGGVGEIRIDGDIIRGGKLLVGSDKLWISDDDKYKFVQQDNGDLVIQRSTGQATDNSFGRRTERLTVAYRMQTLRMSSTPRVQEARV